MSSDVYLHRPLKLAIIRAFNLPNHEPAIVRYRVVAEHPVMHANDAGSSYTVALRTRRLAGTVAAAPLYLTSRGFCKQ